MKNYIFIIITMLLISFSMFAHGDVKDDHTTTESAIANLAASSSTALTADQKLAVEKYKSELESYNKKKLFKKSLEIPVILVDILILLISLFVVINERKKYNN